MSNLIWITVLTKDTGSAGIRLRHNTGNTLVQTLREGGVTLPSLCGVMGKCGRCLVKFTDYVPFPTQTDRKNLSSEELREGYRLSCTAKPTKDCTVELAFAEEKKAGVLAENRLYKAAGGITGEDTVIAVDLGTTTIAMSLIGTASGYVWDTYTCRNPQRSFGTDVIGRIQAGNTGGAELMQELVRDCLWTGTEQLIHCAKENKLCKPQIISIACNITMGHLFMGYSTERLGRSPFLPVEIGFIEYQWNGIDTLLLPGISAFVGSDVVSGLYACGLHKTKEPWLFIDLGTNAEMAVGKGGSIICTAAAAGPAFESGQDDATGSERVQIIAELLNKGIVDETGLMQEPYFTEGIEIKGVRITQEDIRNVQMAKAAIRTGIHFLERKMGIAEHGEISRVYLAGGFGFYLNRAAAVRIGLIPEELESKIDVVGNTALAGAGMFAGRLMSGKQQRNCENQEKEVLEAIITAAEVFNLAEQPEFERIYVENINFDSRR